MKNSSKASKLPTVAAGLLSCPLVFAAACAIFGAVCATLQRPLSAMPFFTVAALAVSGALGTVIFRAVSGIRAPVLLMLPPTAITALYLAVSAIGFGFELRWAHLVYSAVFLLSALAVSALLSGRGHKAKRARRGYFAR